MALKRYAVLMRKSASLKSQDNDSGTILAFRASLRLRSNDLVTKPFEPLNDVFTYTNFLKTARGGCRVVAFELNIRLQLTQIRKFLFPLNQDSFCSIR